MLSWPSATSGSPWVDEAWASTAAAACSAWGSVAASEAASAWAAAASWSDRTLASAAAWTAAASTAASDSAAAASSASSSAAAMAAAASSASSSAAAMAAAAASSASSLAAASAIAMESAIISDRASNQTFSFLAHCCSCLLSHSPLQPARSFLDQASFDASNPRLHSSMRASPSWTFNTPKSSSTPFTPRLASTQSAQRIISDATSVPPASNNSLRASFSLLPAMAASPATLASEAFEAL